MINWNDPKALVSKYFTVKELCWLPSWNQLHSPTLQEQENLTKIAQVMDRVREFLGKPIHVHVCIRPTKYNAEIGGAPNSAHILGLAIDFDCGEDCDDTRKTLLPMLQNFGIRMENKPGSSWVHIDLMPVKNSRFFKP